MSESKDASMTTKILAGVIAMLIGITAWIWDAHITDFREFKSEYREDMRRLADAINDLD